MQKNNILTLMVTILPYGVWFWTTVCRSQKHHAKKSKNKKITRKYFKSTFLFFNLKISEIFCLSDLWEVLDGHLKQKMSSQKIIFSSKQVSVHCINMQINCNRKILIVQIFLCYSLSVCMVSVPCPENGSNELNI